MSKDNDKKKVYNQMAWILNYKPQIGQQHIHMGNQADEEEPVDEEVVFEEDEPLPIYIKWTVRASAW